MQRIAVPYPAPYGSGTGLFGIEGTAHSAILGNEAVDGPSVARDRLHRRWLLLFDLEDGLAGRS